VKIEWLYGVFNGLTFWNYVLITFLMVQVTMMGVTLYLHRDAAHRSVDLHPALRHFFRFWIWATSGMVTREWVAVHRKHHAFSDKPEDPHSPVQYGLRKILLEGAEVYRDSARNAEIVEKYGKGGVPEDWLENNVYAPHRNLGITLYVLTMLVLFGVPGIIMLSIQLIAMPLFAAGVINGVAHAVGYRNFDADNEGRNVLPWGLLVGGEELHNNHHAFPSSARFALARHEFDIGWAVLCILQPLGLARVRNVAPLLPRVGKSRNVDFEMVSAIIKFRMHVTRDYTRRVMIPVFKAQVRESAGKLQRSFRSLFTAPVQALDGESREKLEAVIREHSPLKKVYEARERLAHLWSGAHASNEQLVAHLRAWCAEAEASGIRALEDFAARLRGYPALATA